MDEKGIRDGLKRETERMALKEETPLSHSARFEIAAGSATNLIGLSRSSVPKFQMFQEVSELMLCDGYASSENDWNIWNGWNHWNVFLGFRTNETIRRIEKLAEQAEELGEIRTIERRRLGSGDRRRRRYRQRAGQFAGGVVRFSERLS